MLHNAFRTLCALAITVPAVAGAAQPALTTAVIDGSTVYSPAELFESYREQLGKPIDRAGAQAIAAALQARYTDDGYARADVTLDGDLVARGILRVRIYEPRITRVQINGSAGPHETAVHQAASRIQQMRPVRSSRMQEELRALRELPGLTVTATTRRDAEERNGFLLDVEASFRPVDGLIRFTNRGTEEIGPIFALSQIIANGLLGRQERLGLITANSAQLDEYYGVGGFIDTPIGLPDTRAMLMGFSSRSDPTEAGADLQEIYRRDRLSLRLTHRLPTSARAHWTLFGGLELEDLDIEVRQQQLRDDQLRIATLGTRIGWRIGTNVNSSATVEYLHGLDALGAGLQAQDLITDPRRIDFSMARLTFMHQIRFLQSWQVRLDALGQYSGHVLPDNQRFKIGGDRLGRGFEVAEIAGDRGAGAKVELRRDLSTDAPLVGKTSVYSFYDIGAAWKSNASGRESAATAGLGLAMNTEHLSAYLELATPLTHADVEGKRTTALFGEISYRF